MKSNILIFFAALFSFFVFDKTLALFFHTHKNFAPFFHFLTQFGYALYPLSATLLLFFLFVLLKKTFYQKAMLYLFSSIVLSGIIVDILKVIFGRFRPALFFKEHLFGFSLFHFGSLYNSFPSGHSATAFSLGIGLALLFPKYRYFFILFAILIAFSRVVLTAHYLSDVIIGSFIGALTSVYLYPKFIKEENAKVS